MTDQSEWYRKAGNLTSAASIQTYGVQEHLQILLWGHALANRLCVSHFYRTIPVSIERLKALAPKFIESFSAHLFSKSNEPEWVFLSGNSIFSFRGGSASAYSLSEQVIEDFQKFLDEHFPNEKIDKVFGILPGSTELELRPIGVTGLTLERANYPQDILEDFDHIVKDINSKDPCGRLMILQGEPGSGKTYILRGLIHNCPNAIFIMIPSNTVAELPGPQLLSLLLTQHGDYPESPIVLMIEDADSCLIERQADNMDSIATILNLADGILGQLLDIRVIVTTNADSVEIDKALLRSGRLCRHSEFCLLNDEHAEAIYERLTGRPVPAAQHPYHNKSLGDVYKDAKETR